MTSTLVSAVIALLIGGIKVLWFIADRLDLQGILGPSIDALGNNRNADAFEP
jgi:high-affinity nickel permease